ncbi:hypothetical protein RFI_20037 [Reticulomyxa filosa]|uniref:Uncharacterized protein n=1 Tax=Reticulomyxa filosa TaxID=46433 RepID=X6MTI5_RETFI|nr:hypothetical protein RFI_20037 [Reticulomyxa filosa]|eukprot:ETO17288.1 hypothetical protein RFI_20037 [Reticulomyxa filosa]
MHCFKEFFFLETVLSFWDFNICNKKCNRIQGGETIDIINGAATPKHANGANSRVSGIQRRGPIVSWYNCPLDAETQHEKNTVTVTEDEMEPSATKTESIRMDSKLLQRVEQACIATTYKKLQSALEKQFAICEEWVGFIACIDSFLQNCIDRLIREESHLRGQLDELCTKKLQAKNTALTSEQMGYAPSHTQKMHQEEHNLSAMRDAINSTLADIMNYRSDSISAQDKIVMVLNRLIRYGLHRETVVVCTRPQKDGEKEMEPSQSTPSLYEYTYYYYDERDEDEDKSDKSNTNEKQTNKEQKKKGATPM